LYFSPYTVKTQTISLYRKLGVSSRSQAVQHLRELGQWSLSPEGPQ
jgi:ATP/maltotriose-dependent transcriptional regulator MalT